MKWSRIAVYLEKRFNPEWLHDSHIHEFSATYEKDYRIWVKKYPGFIFDISVSPPWGPGLNLKNLDCSVLNACTKPIIDLWIEWDEPLYKIYLDEIKVHEQPDIELADAAKIGLPYWRFKELKGSKAHYRLKKPPEQSQIWELDEIPIYMRAKYNIQEDRGREFLHTSSNITQTAREVIYTWEYARSIRDLNPEDSMHFALLAPKVDRGIDTYIRLFDDKKRVLAYLPIQICEINVKTDFAYAEADELVLDLVKQAKSHPTCDKNISLLCVLKAPLPALVEVMKLRSLFEKIPNWQYRKIIFMTISNNTRICTVYCEDKDEYVYLERQDDKSIKAEYGRTHEQIQENAQLASQGIDLEIPF